MTACVLEQLKSDEFAISAGFVATAGPLRRFLARSKEVADVRKSLRQGALTEDSVHRFVDSLFADFHRGKQFVHDLAIAAIAVALESRPTKFADEFLHDLARLESAEMGLSIRVARECLKQRASVARSVTKVFAFAYPDDHGQHVVESWVEPRQRNGKGLSSRTLHCEVG